MKTPRLNRKLVLETPQRVVDGAGGYSTVWQTVGTLWAEIISRTGRETAAAEASVSAMNFRIVVRGAPTGAPNRPGPEQRFRDGSRLFIIQAVAETDAEGRYLTCFAREETAL